MIITEEFIMLNLPKTGSTFARNAIIKSHRNLNRNLFLRIKNFGKKKMFIELKMPNVRDYNPSLKPDQHGTYTQIPEKYLTPSREIVSIIRNPFEGYVSRYKFRWYERVDYTKQQREVIHSKYPEFPNFSFLRYCEFENEFVSQNIYDKYGVSMKSGLGILSLQFIQMFSYDVKKMLLSLNESNFQNSDFEIYFPRVSFLRNENLNTDLYKFLLKKGYPIDSIDFILIKEKENVSNSENIENYLCEKSITFIESKERFLFNLFPEYKR
jgi:hypothetical protein